MKLAQLIPQLSMGLSTFCLITATQAGIPVWGFTPDNNFPPKTTVSTTRTATVKYTISNNSSKAHNLVIKPQTGVSQNGPCLLSPKGQTNATCTLTLTITGSALPASGLSRGPILCQANSNGTANPNQCYQPSKANSLAITIVQGSPILRASTADMALSVNGLILNGLPSGQARTIVITNSGDAPATGLVVNYPSWPGGSPATSATDNCNSALAPGDSCTITIVPGTTSTSGIGNAACTTGVAPTPGVVSVSATNTNHVSTNVVILGYGCIYQGGFVYAMTETSDASKSVGGTVIAHNDQAPGFPNGIVWSSNGNGSTSVNVSNDIIPLISETSTSNDSYNQAQTVFNSTYSNTSTFSFPAPKAFASCNGAADGACNTANILALYNAYETHYNISGTAPFALSPGPTNPTSYAAGLCSNYTIDSAGTSPCSTGTCYSNWYLPAICEMGATSNGSGCAVGTQSIIENLPALIGDFSSSAPYTSCSLGVNCLVGFYWSSTANSLNPKDSAWFEGFNISGSILTVSDKFSPLGVRCSRSFK